MPVSAEIQGVSTSEVGDPLPATIAVFVKSSVFGNTEVIGTRIDASNDYSFTYTSPTVAEGACGTTSVAYQELGLNSNNDLLDDGLRNGSTSAASGFRFVTSDGSAINCEVGVAPSAWGTVKRLFR